MQPITSGPYPNDPVLTRDEVRSLDSAAVRLLGIPGLVLMENAARGLADRLQHLAADHRVIVVCGSGNNGGDGLSLARQRAARGLLCQVLLVDQGKSLTPDAQSNLDALLNSGVDVSLNCRVDVSQRKFIKLTPQDWIVDCLLGTGLRGAAREPFPAWIRAINASPASVLAADLPSGLDCDTGLAEGDCVRATVTVTFAARKAGFLNPDSAKWTGEVVVEQIGVPQSWIATQLRAMRVS